ncbi:chemerin-like receptor 1 [Bombina bombina]|uniref:chemerin-like receptor 1 n=1 Tax=Bombina bombina TaxID=8345 RepID=UPI00235A86CB|nr:chemerin-like receptor 1 [Bombina bombina]
MDNVTSTSMSNMFSIETTENSSSPEYDYDYYYEEGYETHLLTQRIVHIFSILVYAVAFILGTIGNGLVIWITGFRMKRTVNTVWFLNLAIADFIFTFFLPLSIVYIAVGFHWPFGTFMCKLNSTIAFLNLFASVFLLTVISIDRCLSVVQPVWSQNHRTPRLASMIAIAVWFIALTASLPYAFFRDTKTDDNSIKCFNNYSLMGEDVSGLGLLRQRSLIITRFIISFVIPFTVIVFCYSVIAFRLRINHLATSTKPFKVIVAVLISFFVCWFPYHVFSFLELSYIMHDEKHLHRILIVGVPITSSLAFVNSCVNPFLYVFIGRDFKDTFHRSLLFFFEKAFSEESFGTDIKSKTKSTSDSQMV